MKLDILMINPQLNNLHKIYLLCFASIRRKTRPICSSKIIAPEVLINCSMTINFKSLEKIQVGIRFTARCVLIKV